MRDLAPPSSLPEVDEARLETDLSLRVAWLAGYIGLTEDERALIRGAWPLLEPALPELGAALGQRLLSSELTRRPFELDGPVDPEVVHRHLMSWLRGVMQMPEDAALARLLDRTAAAHTAAAGDPHVQVPLVAMMGLMGFISDLVTSHIAELRLPNQRKFAAIRAFNKLLWLQADFIARRYAMR